MLCCSFDPVIPLKRPRSLVQMKALFLRYLVFFFSFLEGYYFSFANIFVLSVLKFFTVVMKQRHLKHDLVVSLDL